MAKKKAVKPKPVEYAVPDKVVKLVKKVQALMLAEPKRVDMHDWVQSQKYWEDRLHKPSHYPICGTTGCIAGWTVLASKRLKHDNSGFLILPSVPKGYADTAAKLLDMTKLGVTEGELFYVSGWPTDLRYAYENAEARQDHQGMAQAAVDRLELFITKGE